jgi:hypothetical protein
MGIQKNDAAHDTYSYRFCHSYWPLRNGLGLI